MFQGVKGGIKGLPGGQGVPQGCPTGPSWTWSRRKLGWFQLVKADVRGVPSGHCGSQGGSDQPTDPRAGLT